MAHFNWKKGTKEALPALKSCPQIELIKLSDFNQVQNQYCIPETTGITKLCIQILCILQASSEGKDNASKLFITEE